MIMEEKDKENILEEWYHFIKCLNIGGSFLDARAVQFMNEFRDYLK